MTKEIKVACKEWEYFRGEIAKMKGSSEVDPTAESNEKTRELYNKIYDSVNANTSERLMNRELQERVNER